MAASISIRGRILSKLFHGRLPAAVVHHQRSFCPRWPIGVCPAAFSHTIPVSSSVTETQEPDTLYQRLLVQVKGHDRAVLDSYEFFATLAAQELGLNLEKVLEVPKQIDKLTLLKSVHIFKKHRVQYEMRTHYRNIQISRITGSTARVYLEYIQRNLPEGVAMEITKVALEKIPEHIHEPLWGKTQQTDPDASPSSS